MLALNGLHARVFGDFLWGSPLAWVSRLIPAFTAGHLDPRLDPYRLGFSLVAVGTAWSGALAALWFKYAWSQRAVIGLAAVSSLYGGIESLIALLILALSLLPSTQRWWTRVDER